MNNNIEDKYLKVIEDNVNVSKTGAGTEFLVTISAVAVICFCVFIFSDTIANVVIDNMSDENQVKIENILTGKDSDFKIVVKHPDKLKYLEETKKRIVKLDKRLQRKSVLKINEIEEKQVNAFVLPNGSIYFTSGLLDKVDNKEALTFVLAHELGHYAHRDHLKSIGRELLSGMILSVISFGNKQVGSTFSSFNNMNYINHSQKQETNADRYANHIMYRLYGKNDGAVEFFRFLKKEEKFPELLYYFSTHPSTEKRLYIIQHSK